MELQKCSKDLIADTLFELLQNNRIQDISVDQICRCAKLSRRTFYNEFTDRHAVVEYIYSRMHIGVFYRDGEPVSFCKGVADWNYMVDHEFRGFIKNTMCYNGQNNIRETMYHMGNEYFKAVIRKNGGNPDCGDTKKLVDAYVISTSTLFEQRFYKQPEIDPKTLEKEVLYRFVPYGLVPYLRDFNE